LTVGEAQNIFFSKYRGGGIVSKVFHENTKKGICQLNHPGKYFKIERGEGQKYTTDNIPTVPFLTDFTERRASWRKVFQAKKSYLFILISHFCPPRVILENYQNGPNM
jgi:hypothetical protein